MAEFEESLDPTLSRPKNSKKKLLLLAILFLIVAGAGTGVYFLRGKLWGNADESSPLDRLEEKKTVTGPPKATGFMLAITEITINLVDADSYVRFSMQLEMRDQAALDMGKERMAMIRDAIIMAMTTRSAADIRDDMQNNLSRAKGDILGRLNGFLGEGAVERIFIENIMIT